MVKYITLKYAGSSARDTMANVLAHARGAGACWVITEPRYIDADYRSEHQAFYSKAFRPYSSLCRRLHFFTEEAPFTVDEELHTSQLSSETYVGFMVVRPVPGAPVGRTHLRAPEGQVSLIPPITDEVTLFGRGLSVEGYPFISQDGELGRCTHAAIWTTARYHSESTDLPRILPAEIAGLVPAGRAQERTVPSAGLTVEQMSAVFEGVGLPPVVYASATAQVRESEYTDLGLFARRYLDSGLPVVVAGQRHVATLIGYRRKGDDWVYIVQDDAWGPFEEWLGEHMFINEAGTSRNVGGWEFLVVPLPAKAWVSAEKARESGLKVLRDRWRELRERSSGQPAAAPGEPEREPEIRVVVLKASDLKRSLGDRGYPDSIAEPLRFRPLPKWVWVVEALDEDGAVFEEVVIDSTDHLADLRWIAHRTDVDLRLLESESPAPEKIVKFPLAEAERGLTVPSLGRVAREETEDAEDEPT